VTGSNDLLVEGTTLEPPKLNQIGGSSNRELIAAARRSLTGNWGMGMLGYVLYTALWGSVFLLVISSIFFLVALDESINETNIIAIAKSITRVASHIISLLAGAFAVGFCSYFLGIVQERQARLENLFTGFKRFFTAFGAYFLSTLFTVLWTLLFIIPGIIAVFRYAMVYFILADDDTCGSLEAITRSKEMMVGNKWKYFCLQLRFIGWSLLAIFFTLGIGYLWLIPYMQTSMTHFYEDIK